MTTRPQWLAVSLLLLGLAVGARESAAGFDLSIHKGRDVALSAGNLGIYHIEVVNLGTDPTVGTTIVRDTIPTGLTYSFASGSGWTVTVSGAIVTCRRSLHIDPGDSTTIDIYAQVDAPANTWVVNSASLTSPGDADPSNNRDTDSAFVLLDVPDVTIDKRHVGPFVQSHIATYSLEVRNIGAGQTRGPITVVDSLPPGAPFWNAAGTGWTFGVSGNVVTATYVLPLSVGSTASFSLYVMLDANAPSSITNAASVSTVDDFDSTNNRDVDVAAVVTVPDVELTKRHASLFAVGLDGIYTLVVRNVGNDVTSGPIVVTDHLPFGMSFVAASGPGWAITANGFTVTAQYDDAVAPGDSARFTLTVHVTSPAYPSVLNTADVSLFGEAFLANNFATDPTAILGAPDLAIDKRHTAAFALGANGTYRMVVRNVGTAVTTAVATVRDTLPAGLSFVAASGAGWSIVESGGIVTATYPGALAAGDSAVFTLTTAIDAVAYPSVTNAATVSMPGDANPENDRDVDPTAMGSPDLMIDKRHTVAFAVGVPGFYQFVVRNVGQAQVAPGAIVRDTLPAGLTFLAWSGPWSVGAAGGVVTATYNNSINPNDSTTFSIMVAVGAAAFPLVSNAATVSTPGDLVTANDRDVDPTAVRGPDLSIDKRHTVAFAVGVNGMYRIVVRNIGGGGTPGVTTVRDTLPAGISFVSGSGTNWTVGESAGIVTATDANVIAAGDSAVFTLTVDVGPAAYPFVSNAATVSVSGDANPANDRDVDPTAVVAGVDVGIDKRHTTPFVVGLTGTYRIVVRNLGSLATGGATAVLDTLPAGTGYVSATGSGWTIGESGGVVTATYPAIIARGDSAAFTLTVSVAAAAYPSVTNAASVSSPGDLIAANDRDVDPTAIRGLPDPTIDKRHVDAFTVGATGHYTFVVRNVGTDPTLTATTVRDTLPLGLVYSGIAGEGWSATLSGAVVTATYSKVIAGGDSASCVLSVAVGLAAFPSVTNAATVELPGEGDTSNDRDVDVAPVVVPDLAIDLRHTTPFVAGQSGSYTVVVTNVGLGATSGVATVRDTLPLGLGFVSGTGAGWTVSVSGPVVTAVRPSAIAAGDSAAFALTVSVGGAAMPTATNRASVSTPFDLSPGNDVDVDSVAIGPGVTSAPLDSGPFDIAAVAPNPVRTAARVTFSVPARARVRISVVDVMGREVALVSDAERAVGNHTVTLDARGWRAGLYFVRLQGPAGESRRRIAVIR